MKIKFIFTSDPEDCDCRQVLTINIDNKQVFSVCDGEPEDNTLCRNFSDVFNIEDMLRTAYEAGKRGEELIIEKVAANLDE